MELLDTSVTLHEIRVFARHGVLPAERIIGNDYTVTLTLRFPAGEAMESDDLSRSVNYADAAALVHREMAVPSLLLERVAFRILSALESEFPLLTGAECAVTKLTPPIPGLQSSGVTFTASARFGASR